MGCLGERIGSRKLAQKRFKRIGGVDENPTTRFSATIFRGDIFHAATITRALQS
eukprot:SAG11_NODE_3359_length_2501_cov_1.511657_1_plen_53_part_10